MIRKKVKCIKTKTVSFQSTRVALRYEFLSFACNAKSFTVACVVFLFLLVGVSELDYQKTLCEYLAIRKLGSVRPKSDLLPWPHQ